MVYQDDDHNCQTTFPLNIIMIILLFILGNIIQIIKNLFNVILLYNKRTNVAIIIYKHFIQINRIP